MFKFNDKEYETEEEVEHAVRIYAEETYDDFLDEIYGFVTIGNIRFYASEILKNCDPIAYGCGINDYEDSLHEEVEEE